MANPSVTYAFVNTQVSDGPQVSQNFTDLINALTDGTKTLTISSIVVGGAATFNGDVNLGDSTSDTLVFTGHISGSPTATTTNSFDLGTSSIKWRDAYLAGTLVMGSITGIADGSAAASGKLGEVLSASTGGVNAPTSTQFGDLCSQSITAGRWLLLVSGEGLLNTGTAMVTVGLGIGTATGNSSTGITSGQNFHTAAPPTANYAASVSACQLITIASPTTYYAKTYAEYGGGTPQFRGIFYAIRM